MTIIPVTHDDVERVAALRLHDNSGRTIEDVLNRSEIEAIIAALPTIGWEPDGLRTVIDLRISELEGDRRNFDHLSSADSRELDVLRRVRNALPKAMENDNGR